MKKFQFMDLWGKFNLIWAGPKSQNETADLIRTVPYPWSGALKYKGDTSSEGIMFNNLKS